MKAALDGGFCFVHDLGHGLDAQALHIAQDDTSR